MKVVFLVGLLLGSLAPLPVFAHPGRTDAYGCHACRTNCSSWGLSYGEYHCHNAKTLPQPKEPIKSKYGANGTGYTQPAPEYKQESSIKTVSVEEKIKQEVLAQRNAYDKNPHMFRERLISSLENKFGKNPAIGRQAYSLLPDQR